jgi:hypothetical protein
MTGVASAYTAVDAAGRDRVHHRLPVHASR